MLHNCFMEAPFRMRQLAWVFGVPSLLLHNWVTGGVNAAQLPAATVIGMSTISACDFIAIQIVQGCT